MLVQSAFKVISIADDQSTSFFHTKNFLFYPEKKEGSPYTTLRLDTLARSLGIGPVNRLSLSRLPDKKDNKRNEGKFILQFPHEKSKHICWNLYIYA